MPRTAPALSDAERQRRRERQRRYKARRRCGVMVVPVEIELLDSEALAESGFLAFDEVEDREAIAKAFRRWLDSLRDGG